MAYVASDTVVLASTAASNCTTLSAMSSSSVLPADLDQQAFARAVTGMAFVSAEGGVLKTNPAFCRIVGYDQARLSDIGWYAVVHPDDLAVNRAAVHRLLTGESGTDQWEMRFLHRLGHAVRARLTVSVAWFSDSRILLAQVQENTAILRAEVPSDADSGSIDVLLDSLSEGIVVEDDRHTICLASARFCQLLECQDHSRRVVGSHSEMIEFMIASITVDPAEFCARVTHLRDRRSAVRGERVGLADGRTLERDYIPLISDGELCSHLWVYRDVTNRVEAEKFNHEQIARLRRWNSRLAALASTDSLTGLPNRRSLFQRLVVALRQSGRDGLPLSLALLDVDRFKEFNDNFGHPAGDEVLTSLASLIRKVLRPDDVPARFGGEEFAILMPGTDAAEAILVAERFRRALVCAPWPLRPVTASFGVATVVSSTMREDDAARVLIASADAALYRSKAAGRNRTTHAEDPFGEQLEALMGASSPPFNNLLR